MLVLLGELMLFNTDWRGTLGKSSLILLKEFRLISTDIVRRM
jgi:hypothetical protein